MTSPSCRLERLLMQIGGQTIETDIRRRMGRRCRRMGGRWQNPKKIPSQTATQNKSNEQSEEKRGQNSTGSRNTTVSRATKTKEIRPQEIRHKRDRLKDWLHEPLRSGKQISFVLRITPLLHMRICDILGMCCARQSSARTSNLFLLVCGLLSCLKMMEMERVARRLKPKNPTHGFWCCFIKCVTEYWFNMTIKSFLIHARIFTRGFDDDLAVSKTGYVNIPGTDSHYLTLSCFDPLASGFTMFYPLKFPPPFGPLRWLSCGLSFSLDRHFAWETAGTQTDTLQFTTSNDQHSHCKIWQVVIRCVETFEVQLSHSTEAMSLEAQAI